RFASSSAILSRNWPSTLCSSLICHASRASVAASATLLQNWAGSVSGTAGFAALLDGLADPPLLLTALVMSSASSPPPTPRLATRGQFRPPSTPVASPASPSAASLGGLAGTSPPSGLPPAALPVRRLPLFRRTLAFHPAGDGAPLAEATRLSGAGS